MGLDSETLQMFAAEGYTELVTANGYSSTRTSLYEKPFKFADYMLINKVNAVSDFEVLYEPEVSDHCPLVLTL